MRKIVAVLCLLILVVGTILAAIPGISSASSPDYDVSIVSCDSQKFPFIYLTAKVSKDGQPINGLTQADFSITEDGQPQTDMFQVTPPQVGGGVRMADIVFLIDASGSMSTEIAAVRNNAIAFADALAASGIDHRLGLVQFGNTSGPNPGIIGGGLTASAETFKQWVGMVQATGGYQPGFAAIRLAIQSYNFRPGSQKVFILISDEDSDDREKQATIDLILANDVTVHVAVDSSFGTANADYCGAGSVRDISGGLQFPVTGNFSVILETISEEVANTYIVRYRTDNPALDGIERSVVCTVDDGTSTGWAQCSYVPGGAPRIQRTQETLALHNQSLVAGSSPTISVTVTDAAAPFIQNVSLFIRTTGSGSAYAEINMQHQGSDLYLAEVPGSSVQTPGLDYYIRATDGQVTSTDPSTDPDKAPYQIAVLPNVAPLITHAPPSSWQRGSDLDLVVGATDSTYAIGSLAIFYRAEGELLWQSIVRTYGGGLTTAINETCTLNVASWDAAAIEYYISVTDDLGLSSLWPQGGADDPHRIEAPLTGTISGEVIVTTPYAEEFRLSGVKVLLTHQTQDDPYLVVDYTTTSNTGNFSFGSVTSGVYRVLVWLQNGGVSGDAVFSVYHNDVLVNVASPPINCAAGSTQNVLLDFNYSNPNLTVLDLTTSPYSEPTTALFPLDRLDDLAAIYYHTKQVVDFSQGSLGVTLDLDLPIEVHAYVPDDPSTPDDESAGAWFDWAEVHIGEGVSGYENDNRPMNREWHEMFHELMNDTVGIPNYPSGTTNHGGYQNSSTADSWVEGWAEFWPCVLWDTLGYSDPHIYRMSGLRILLWWVVGGPQNFEENWKAWDTVGSNAWGEEFGVASLLWDLYDPADARDSEWGYADHLDLTLEQMWAIMGHDQISDMKDFYDRFKAAGIGADDPNGDAITQLDELFIIHGFFVDSNSNHRYDRGEEIGRAGDRSRPNRRNNPGAANANILMNAVDSEGNALTEGMLVYEFHYDSPRSYLDYTYETPIRGVDAFLAHLEPSPTDRPVVITMYIRANMGGAQVMSDRLVVSNDVYWELVEGSNAPYAAVHVFQIGLSGQTTVLTRIDFDPHTLNLKSNGKYVTSYIELPEGYDVGQIDVSSIRLNGTIPALAKPTSIGDYDKDGRPDLMVKFDRAAVEKILTPGDQVVITIEGKVAGVDFQGTDTIRVIAKGKATTAGIGGNIPYLGYILAGLLGCLVIAASLFTFFMWGRPLPTRN